MAFTRGFRAHPRQTSPAATAATRDRAGGALGMTGSWMHWGAQEERLLRRAHSDGDRAAIEELVVRMMPLVRRLARKYQGHGDQLDDMVQVASLALFKAIQRFDPDRGTPFLAYASPSIAGALLRYRRDCCWSVRLPRGLQDQALHVNREYHRLSGKLGREPTLAELAHRCGLPVDVVREARLARAAYSSLSLEAMLEARSERQIQLPTEERGYRRIEDVEALGPAISALPQRERWIVALRFCEGLSQVEIASRVGISQMHVSRLLRRALDRMRPIIAQTL
jgi:RNA polymerase sigma-B factor